jgi:phosphate transport system substrate-binding protein
MQSRIIKVLSLVVGASFLLTACDPPMPPEVAAALAEQSYTCITGDTKLSAPESILSVSGDWQTGVAMNCEADAMTITPVPAAGADVELQIGDPADSSCKAYLTVPYALDAPVLAFQLAGISGVNLSASAIGKISSGAIKTWDDPDIVALNPNTVMPSTPVVFGNEVTKEFESPFAAWMQRLSGSQISLPAGTVTADALIDGGIVLTSYSKAMARSLALVGIVTGKNLETDVVVPEAGSINSAGTMFKAKAAGGVLELTFDSKAKPIAPEGINVAPSPYQALVPINLRLCGVDSLKTRAAAKYILRQDSQGSLGLSTVTAIPENLRAVALGLVSVGLPAPSPLPSN